MFRTTLFLVGFSLVVAKVHAGSRPGSGGSSMSSASINSRYTIGSYLGDDGPGHHYDDGPIPGGYSAVSSSSSSSIGYPPLSPYPEGPSSLGPLDGLNEPAPLPSIPSHGPLPSMPEPEPFSEGVSGGSSMIPPMVGGGYSYSSHSSGSVYGPLSGGPGGSSMSALSEPMISSPGGYNYHYQSYRSTPIPEPLPYHGSGASSVSYVPGPTSDGLPGPMPNYPDGLGNLLDLLNNPGYPSSSSSQSSMSMYGPQSAGGPGTIPRGGYHTGYRSSSSGSLYGSHGSSHYEPSSYISHGSHGPSGYVSHGSYEPSGHVSHGSYGPSLIGGSGASMSASMDESMSMGSSPMTGLSSMPMQDGYGYSTYTSYGVPLGSGVLTPSYIYNSYQYNPDSYGNNISGKNKNYYYKKPYYKKKPYYYRYPYDG